MPVLNVTSIGEGKRKDGSVIRVPGRVALRMRGPVIPVTVGIGQHIANQIAKSGGTIPRPVSGLAMIDTGAATTCVDEDAAKALGLPAIDVVKVASASHEETDRNVYPIQIDVPHWNLSYNVARAVGAPLAVQGIVALIGRDMLESCVLIYNGLEGTVSLSI